MMQVGQFKTLREVLVELAVAKEEEVGGWLFLPRNEQWTLESKAVLLDLDDVDDDEDEPDVAKKASMKVVLEAADIKSIINNAKSQNANVNLDGILSALLYYYRFDAFKDLSKPDSPA